MAVVATKKETYLQRKHENNYHYKIFQSPSFKRYYDNDVAVVFDFDDTLFPTAQYLTDRKRGYLINDELIYYHGVANAVIHLLVATLYYVPSTQICIVTNSKDGFVWKSLAFYGEIIAGFQQISLILQAYQIEVVSARSKYRTPDTTPEKWKQTAYDKHVVFANNNHRKSHVITMGDQWYDHTAMEKSLKNHQNVLHHQIKMKASPKLSYLIQELIYVKQLLIDADYKNKDEGTLYEFE